MPKDKNKPKGRMSSYAYFVQTCREEHKKKHPTETVVFKEFSQKCASRWKTMKPAEKGRFEEMAEKDKKRYEREMAGYNPPAGGGAPAKGKKRTKDPNAPKRALSAFFFFCGEERAAIRKVHPSYNVGEVAKELGKLWEKCPNKPKYEAQAAADKKRYEAEMQAYKSGGVVKKTASPKKQRVVAEEDDEEDDDDDEEDDDDDEDDDE